LIDWREGLRLIISNQVLGDITEIYKYIARNSLKYAQETIDNIYYCIAELESSPYIGRYVPEIPSKKYREILYKSYRIIYSVSLPNNSIYIHFVIHNKRNFEAFYHSYLRREA